MKKLGDISFLRKLAHILFLRPLLKLVFGVNFIGKENLRNLDKYIIIANHNSHLDIVLLFCLLPVRDIVLTHPIADEDYFSKSRIVFRLVDFFFKPIWITRGKPDHAGDPLGGIKEKIDNGHKVIIFPEGTRGKPGELQHFKSGIGRLVAQYPDLPIVPVFLSGPERALPKASSLLLPFWNHVIIGPPQVSQGTHREITQSLEGILIGLSSSAAARRHKRKPRKKKYPPLIACLGIDGSGKSTLSRSVAQELSGTSSVCLISDRLEFYEHGDHQGIQPLVTEKLREVIGGYAKKAKSLKLYKIPKLAELLLRDHLLHEVRRWYSPDIVVMDGCPLLNIAAWAVLYKKDPLDNETLIKAMTILTGEDLKTRQGDPIFVRFPELSYLRRMKLNKLMLPDVVIFLDVDPTVACQRITARGEQKQVHETEEKLCQLHEAYLQVCRVIQQQWRIPTSRISGEDTPENVASAGLEFVRRSLNVEN